MSAADNASALGEGIVIRVQGPVIDVEFHGECRASTRR